MQYNNAPLNLAVVKLSESVCEVSAVGKISECQPGGPGFNLRPG